jgi:hypothetical protein
MSRLFTLDGKRHVDGTVIDHLLHIFNKDTYHIVSVSTSTSIFMGATLSDSFIDELKVDLEKDTAFVICLGSHFTMVILSIKSKTLTFIDPIGNEKHHEELYVKVINGLY